MKKYLAILPLLALLGCAERLIVQRVEIRPMAGPKEGTVLPAVEGRADDPTYVPYWKQGVPIVLPGEGLPAVEEGSTSKAAPAPAMTGAGQAHAVVNNTPVYASYYAQPGLSFGAGWYSGGYPWGYSYSYRRYPYRSCDYPRFSYGVSYSSHYPYYSSYSCAPVTSTYRVSNTFGMGVVGATLGSIVAPRGRVGHYAVRGGLIGLGVGALLNSSR